MYLCAEFCHEDFHVFPQIFLTEKQNLQTFLLFEYIFVKIHLMLLLSQYEVAEMQWVEFQEICLNVIEMQNVHLEPNLAHFSTFVVN